MKGVEVRNTNDLRPHEANFRIYGEDEVEGFEESVRRNGIQQPLHVTADGTIVAGHRRWRTAIKVGIKRVPVIVVDGSADDIMVRLIESNRCRQKTNEQKMREGRELMRIEDRRAERRARRTRSADTSDDPPQEGKTDSNCPRINLSVDKDGPPIHNQPSSAPGYPSLPDTGRTLDRVAEQVGTSRSTLIKGMKVVERIDQLRDAGEEGKAAELAETLNRSVDGAHKKVFTVTAEHIVGLTVREGQHELEVALVNAFDALKRRMRPFTTPSPCDGSTTPDPITQVIKATEELLAAARQYRDHVSESQRGDSD